GGGGGGGVGGGGGGGGGGGVGRVGLPDSLPPHLRQILGRCLDRDPKTRLRDIGEVRVALSGAELSDLPADPRHGGTRMLVWGVTALLGFACALALWSSLPSSRPRRDSVPAYRFQVATPTMLDQTDFDVSPDGRTLAFVALEDSEVPAVWLRPLDAADASVLPGTEGARGVFWSPDSRAVG